MTVVVSDPVEELVEEQRKAVERVVQGRGFVAVSETLNAVEAWLSSVPGHCYANVRQALVSTLNLAQLLPISEVWAGPERNAHHVGPPLLVCRTTSRKSDMKGRSVSVRVHIVRRTTLKK